MVAEALAGDDGAGEGVVVAEEAVDEGDVAGGEGVAYFRGTDVDVVLLEGAFLLDEEVVLLSQGLEVVEVALAVVAEVVVVADDEAADAEAANEDADDEVGVGEAGEVEGEGEDDEVVDTETGEAVYFFVEGGEESGFLFGGLEDFAGVGFEADDDGLAADGGGFALEVTDDAEVAEVYAVETADGDHRVLDVGIFNSVMNFHARCFDLSGTKVIYTRFITTFVGSNFNETSA